MLFLANSYSTTGFFHNSICFVPLCLLFQDAQKAIPKGTLLAILISTITYILIAIMAGACVLRDASGIEPTMILESTVVENLTALITSTVETLTETPSPGGDFLGRCDANNKCEYGLQNDMQVKS